MRESSPRLILREKAAAEMQRSFLRGKGQALLRTTSQALRASSPNRGNGDDRRQRRKQGGAVGAAASRMQAAAQQTLGAATRHGRGAPERARTLTNICRRCDSIILTKSLLIAAQRLYRRWLALSVTFGATSPKGRGFSASPKIPLIFSSAPSYPSDTPDASNASGRAGRTRSGQSGRRGAAPRPYLPASG